MAKSTICLIPNCGKYVEACGWCNAHYARWRAHKDPLGGGTPRGDPMRFIVGTVLPYTGDDCLIWPYARNNRGRASMSVDGKTQFVSRYICEKKNGPPPSSKHQAAHECGKGHLGCISPSHLSWKTRGENEADKILHGTHNRGERSGAAKLSEDDVRQIRELTGQMSSTKIGQLFGVRERQVRDIQKRKRWAHLD